MKSSSALFPVELVSTEVLGDRYIDCYSLKPNNSHDKTVELAVIHVTPKQTGQTRRQVLFVHDAFQSHWQWLDGYQQCINDAIAHGVGLWLMDWRSHGSSKKNKQPQLNTISEMARFDVPAVLAFVREKSCAPVDIVASGYGAQMVLESLCYQSSAERIALLDAKPVLGRWRFWLPGSKLFWRSKYALRPWFRGAGPEMESGHFGRDQLRRHGWSLLFRRAYRRQLNATIERNMPKITWFFKGKSSSRVARRYRASAQSINILDQEDQGLAVSHWIRRSAS